MENLNTHIESGNFQSVLPKNLVEKASEILKEIEYPTTRNEHWKYTRLTKISKKNFVINNQFKVDNIKDFKIIQNAYNLVFVNGFFQESLSSNEDLEGVEITPISNNNTDKIGENIKLETEIFNSLNTVYATGGFAIKIKSSNSIEKPIQIINISTNEHVISTTRNHFILEKNSKAFIVQTYFSNQANQIFDNHINEYLIGENANLTVDKIQQYSDEVYAVITEQIEQEKGSIFTQNTFSLDGDLIRNNTNIEVKGENCTTNINGIYLGNNNQHIDNHTTIDHIAPHCNSNELYKGIATDKSTIVFNGKVYVRPNAQKINAFQSNANILLSDDASINSKPELEIYADDVKCSHGSTTGQLDEEAIFYLQARGISRKSAINFLIGAFLEDVTEKIKNDELKDFVQKRVESKLEIKN